LANYTDGLRIYDISNPASPVNVGHIDNGNSGRGICVQGNYAYLANYSDGLRIYEVNDTLEVKGNLTVVGNITAANLKMQCATLRRYENFAKGLQLVYTTGGGPGTVDEIAYMDEDPSTPFATSYFGIVCNEANGWTITGCSHTGTEADNDYLMHNNGCYADDNDATQDTNMLDVVCCRIGN